MTDEFSKYVEKDKTQLKTEHDSMVEEIRGNITANKHKALSKI
jgi:hypothetical protein